ncbi:hypothetical protein Landi51_10597 [Colletotrichum acutatum]
MTYLRFQYVILQPPRHSVSYGGSEARLAKNIFVVRSWDAQDPPREPLAIREDLAGNIAWHTISQQPLSEPRIESISLHVDVLERWQRGWIKWHEQHASPDDDDCIYGELPGDDDVYHSEGSSSKGEEQDDENDDGELSYCCDTDRSKRGLPLVIEAFNKEYTTIHDYVSTLHPTSGESESLVVDVANLDYLSIMDQKRFPRSGYTGTRFRLRA